VIHRRAPPRTIIIERLVDARIRQATELYPRLNEVWEALLWRLERDPTCGMKQPVMGNWYALKTIAWRAGRVPSITLLYQVDGKILRLRSSRIDELDEFDEECR
jgi:hypothetical protein